MSLHFAHAWVLLLLLVVAGLAAGLVRRDPPAGRQRTLWMLLPGTALGLTVLALSAPQVWTGAQRPTTFIVDHSASIDADMRGVASRWSSSRRSDDCVAPCRVVRFAAATDTLADRTTASGQPATDVESALATAISLTPRGGRAVLLSDGGQTQGDALAIAGLARRRDVRVDWVPLADRTRRDAAITSMRLPAAARVGDDVALALTVHSTVAATAVLRIRRDNGTPASQTIHLQVGDNPLDLSFTAVRQGWSSFAATVVLPGDTVSANNSSAAVVDVGPAPRVLVATRSATSPVPALLAGRRLSVRTVAPADLPVAGADYSGYDAVVLDDVPAAALGAKQVSALDSAVRSDGMGLVALGGPDSFSEGRYWESKLQQILPVTSLKPGKLQRKNLAVELVLDHSGSMIDLAGGAPKIAEARASAHQAATFIASHRDQIGIVDFDTAAHTLVPLTSLAPGASERAVDARIATLQASGGTNIYAGLQAGFNALLKSKAPERHLILVTDGISTGADYGPLLALMRREKIAAATVALGTDADRKLLAQIASATGGHTYATDNANDLPRILVKETQESAKPVRVTGRLGVTLSGDSPIVRALIGTQLPALTGNEVVKLKRGAQADLRASGQSAQTDPALAEWQIGTGRVVAWTPGLGAPWALSWLKRPALWNDAVRWAQRGIATPRAQPTVTSPGTLAIDLSSRGRPGLGVRAITGSLTGTDGIAHRVRFTQSGPAAYRADVAGLAGGVYRYTLTGQGSAGFTASGEVALPYPAEYSPVSVQTSPLGQLVAQTGGRVLAPGDPSALSGARHGLARLLVLLALATFLLGVAARMGARLRRASPVG